MSAEHDDWVDCARPNYFVAGFWLSEAEMMTLGGSFVVLRYRGNETFQGGRAQTESGVTMQKKYYESFQRAPRQLVEDLGCVLGDFEVITDMRVCSDGTLIIEARSDEDGAFSAAELFEIVRLFQVPMCDVSVAPTSHDSGSLEITVSNHGFDLSAYGDAEREPTDDELMAIEDGEEESSEEPIEVCDAPPGFRSRGKGSC